MEQENASLIWSAKGTILFTDEDPHYFWVERLKKVVEQEDEHEGH
jgi:hypothetical protein